ncbi:two-component regulator propeller domain-containing protein [Saccharicrinis aurantiacus]|uniref:two-component regulator propeller domain-containing protein n=1 Tax=Saccharicrinis aurantiacus TaxID=1849719 RepID=UPI00094F9903|nr:two-component regulator propeller domain-containing protein [Saccharicrinis aurantiacus]
MRNIIFTCLNILLILLYSITLSANNIDKALIKIRTLENQPQNEVNFIFQDKNGFMWIGTLDGLHKYDGYTYKTYQVENNINSISSNLIKSIAEDSKGNIWVGTYDKGICKLDPRTDEFTNYYNTPNKELFNTNDITTLIIDNNDIIWTANWQGINRIKMDSTMANIESIDIIPFDTGKEGFIKVLHQDKFNNIWIGTNNVLLRLLNPDAAISNIKYQSFNINSETICNSDNGIYIGSVSVYHIETKDIGKNTQAQIIDAKPSSALFWHNNILWIGNRNGLFKKEKMKDHWLDTLPFIDDFTGNQINCNIVSWITSDKNNQIWIGTRGGGVNIARESKKPFEHYKNTTQKGSLSNNLCRSVFEDSEENLWIGTEEEGVNFLKKGSDYKSGFIKLDVNKDSTNNRAYAIEESIHPKSTKHKRIIWVGTSHSTNLCGIDANTLKEVVTPPYISSLGFVFTIKCYKNKYLWVGTYGEGLYRLTLNEQGEISAYLKMTPSSKDNSSILSHIIRSINIDSKGNLWVGTDKGLNVLPSSEINSDKPKFARYTKGSANGELTHDYILQVYEAKNKDIWIGTMGGGLMKFNDGIGGNKPIFTNYTKTNGLPNNTIKSICEDTEGNLWLATNKGISKYNTKNKQFTNYDKSHGLQDNEFSEICAITRNNGQIVMGGINGLNVFSPEKIKKDLLKPNMFFTNFYIDNQEITTHTEGEYKGILKNNIQYTKELELDYDNNSFSIDFVALNYTSPQNNKYQYKLEGFDEQWYKASAGYRTAKYTNVPPGTYTFKAIGSNGDNVWSDHPASVSITIKPPFYRTWLAFIFYFIVLAMLAVLQRRTAYMRHKRKNELIIANIEKNKIEEISQMKLKFFTNISHEFRTPLTLISGPIEKLLKDNNNSNPTDRRSYLELINQNVKVMMRLINQLMDFRKMEQEKLLLKVNAFNMVEFTATICNSFAELANQKEINYEFTHTQESIQIWGDQDKLEKAIYNLLSNAFKFTKNKGSINVKLKVDSKNAYISIKDTGLGISKENQQHVFERYFRDRTHLQSNAGGTGIGLALSKGMVELHSGKITLESEPDIGSTFTIILPLGNRHFKKEEIEQTSTAYAFNQLSTNQSYTEEPTIINEDEVTIQSPAHKAKILIAEDNNDLMVFITKMLKSHFTIMQAEDGKAALDLCKKSIPDLIISDIMMPNINGIELCKTIKSTELTSHIPVILLTAKNTIESQIEGLETGADSYLNKPFNFEVLLASINSILQNRAQLRKKFQKEIEINPTIIANNSTDTKFIDKILAIIEENLSDSSFTVEKLAETYGVSRIYLNRKIKALTGETSNQFIRNIRLKHAAELLKQGNMNVSEVTWMVGYNDLKTFRVRFKEKFNISPSDYSQQFN